MDSTVVPGDSAVAAKGGNGGEGEQQHEGDDAEEGEEVFPLKWRELVAPRTSAEDECKLAAAASARTLSITKVPPGVKR